MRNNTGLKSSAVFARMIAAAIFIGFVVLILYSCESGSPGEGSRIKGVQIGVITYSYRSMPDQSLQAILDYVVQSGIRSVELMSGPVEQYLGIPQGDDRQAVRDWRLGVPDAKVAEVRDMFHAQGVNIDIFKVGNILNWPDDEIDRYFEFCRILGARGISLEISEAAAERLAPFGEKHDLYVIFHNHGQPAWPDFSFDRVLSHGFKLMLNLDVGHYYGYTGLHPNELITRLHDRIASIHLKDKSAPDAPEPNKNRPWGEGDTPIRDILQLIRDNKWPITFDIEIEYPIPEGSDAVKEVAVCLAFCREALTGR